MTRSCIIGIIITSGLLGHVADIGEKRNTTKILQENLKERDDMDDQVVNGMIILK
jgi:hypothetical protein